MPFKSHLEAEARLTDSTPLNVNEVRDLMPWLGAIRESGRTRLNVELAIRNLQAVEKFDKSSTRLAWAIALLTLILAIPILTDWIKWVKHLIVSS